MDITAPGLIRGDNFKGSQSIGDFVVLFPTFSRKVSNTGPVLS